MSSPTPSVPPYLPDKNDPRERHYFDILMRRRLVEANGIPWAQVDKTGSSLADLATRRHDQLTELGDDDHTQYVHLTNPRTITGLVTFDRDPAAPFAVSASSAAVTNLDADLLDGQHGGYYRNADNLNAGTVVVARGGTGRSSLTVNRIPYGNGTNAIQEHANLTFDGTNLVIGQGANLSKVLTATATLDFPNTAAQTSSDLTITLTGAVDGDAVILGVPNAASNANSDYSAWVSAADTVTVRFNNYSAGAINPGSGTFRVTVLKH